MFNYDRLDLLIKETGKKKNYLGIKMGYSGRYLNDAKKQNTDIKGEPLQILADELGTTPEYLTGVSNKKEKSPAPEGVGLSEDQKKAIDKILSLSPEELAKKMAALEAVLDM